MDWLHKRGVKDPVPLFGAIVAALSLLPGVLMPLAPSATMDLNVSRLVRGTMETDLNRTGCTTRRLNPKHLACPEPHGCAATGSTGYHMS